MNTPLLAALLSLTTAVFAHAEADAPLVAEHPAEVLLNEIVAFAPGKNHHFNEKAPHHCGGGRLIEVKETGVQCQFPERKIYKPVLQVCDDANTYCKQAPLTVAVEGSDSYLVKLKSYFGIGEDAPAQSFPTQGDETPNHPARGFIQNDVAKARRLAKERKAPILLFFSQLYCPPCNLMKETSFATDEFQEKTKDFVKLQLDADITTYEKLITALDLNYTPTLVVLDADMREIGKAVTFGSPTYLRRWLDEESANLDAPIAEVEKRIAAAEDGGTMEDRTRLGIFKFRSLDFKKAEELLKAPAQKDARAEKYLRLANIRNMKTAERLKTLPAAIPSMTDCQSNDYLWNIVPDKDEKIEPADLKKRADLIALAYRRSNAPKGLELDCRLNRAYLKQMEGALYRNTGDFERAGKSYRAAADIFGEFLNPQTGKTAQSAKLHQALSLAKLKDRNEGDRLLDELNGEDAGNYTFDYLRASGLLGDKKYDEALAAARAAAKKATAKNALRIAGLEASILVKADRKAEAEAFIRGKIAEINLPKDKDAYTHRFIQKLRRLQMELKTPKEKPAS